MNQEHTVISLERMSVPSLIQVGEMSISAQSQSKVQDVSTLAPRSASTNSGSTDSFNLISEIQSDILRYS